MQMSTHHNPDNGGRGSSNVFAAMPDLSIGEPFEYRGKQSDTVSSALTSRTVPGIIRNMTIFAPSPQIKTVALIAIGLIGSTGPVHAHASEQGFVLLLPTDVYIMAGALCVAVTVLLLAVLPGAAMARLFRPIALIRLHLPTLPLVTSLTSTVVLLGLIWIGLTGPRDPLTNLLPLTFWTLWWVGFVSVQGLLGNLWRFVNPWTGIVALIRRLVDMPPVLRFPTALGHSVAILTFLGFGVFLLADPAPADPTRLARIAGLYWAVTCLGILLFGPRWLYRAEGFSVLLHNYAALGVMGRKGSKLALGLSGWQVMARRSAPPIGLAVFMILMLGSGSFDGLNETFWWLGLLGINPLEFPGRSAVITQNVAGLLIANVLLIAAYGLAVRLGQMLAPSTLTFMQSFRMFAPTILPIALGYHVAHYLTSFLVDGQYALVAFSDPMSRGADLLGLGTFYVSTGFFNAPDSVRTIWLTQAGAVVAGHVLAVVLAHAIAVRQYRSNRFAALSQAPLALFMILYTLFGLWLLASPRGA